MPEILTESFCERCGTRYTFESAAPKAARLKGLKVVSRGLRNFVMSDDTSIDEAMAAARNETDREATSQQLDAFHKTFNFCMSCRQYTCSNCWNEVEGRCLSCAPNLGHEVLPAPFPNLDTGNGLPFGATGLIGDTNGHEHADASPSVPMAWPTSDLMREEAGAVDFADLLARHEAEAPEAEAPEVEASIEDDESFDPLARLAALDAMAPTAAPEPVAEIPEPLDVEPEAIGAEPFAVAEPEPQPEPFAVAEPEPVAAASEPEPEPVAAASEPEPVAVDEPEPVAAIQADIEPEPQPAIADAADEEDDRAAAAAARTTDLLQRFRPGQSLDDAIAAYERTQAAADVLAPLPPAASEPEPVAAAPEPVIEPEPEPVAEPELMAPEPEPVAAAPEPEPVAAALEPVAPPAPEPIAAAPLPAPEPEPVWPPAAAAAAPPFTLTPAPRAPEPELDRAAASAFPWSVDREPTQPEPADAEPGAAAEPVAAEPRSDVVPQPTWQIMAPDTTDEPQWPAPPAWPGAGPADGLPFLGRPAQPTGGIDALWAESAREVATAQVAAPGPDPLVKPAGGVQPCVSCGLSLSANARFCRRCGTRQG